MEKKRYFIGFKLEGAPKKHVEDIAESVVAEYGVRNVFKRYPAHLTFKAPFDASEGEIKHELVPYLTKFVKGREAIDVELEGFGHFNTGVIYCDVLQNSVNLQDLQKELCDGLEEINWMTFEKNEPNGIPHVTVAIDDIKGRFKEIFRYLKDKFPGYTSCSIDGIQLFEKRGRRWEVLQEFKF